MVGMRKCCFVVMGAMLMAGLAGCGLSRKDVTAEPVPEVVAADAGSGQENVGESEPAQENDGMAGAAEDGQMRESEADLMREPGTDAEAWNEADVGGEMKQEEQPLPWTVMVNGALYVYSGECDDEGLRCGMMDGEITGRVPENEVPTQDNESNFATGYGYQYGRESEIEVHMPLDDSGELHWLVFRKSGFSGEGREDFLLTDAPALSLKDALSSTMDCFTVQPGNYTWTFEEDGEGKSFAACGAHPLDDVPYVHMPVLTLPAYNGLDSVPYLFSCAVMPDSVTVRKWKASAAGNPDAPADSVTTLSEGVSLMELEKDCIYEFILEWEQKRLEETGYCGTASYAFVTQ